MRDSKPARRMRELVAFLRRLEGAGGGRCLELRLAQLAEGVSGSHLGGCFVHLIGRKSWFSVQCECAHS